MYSIAMLSLALTFHLNINIGEINIFVTDLCIYVANLDV